MGCWVGKSLDLVTNLRRPKRKVHQGQYTGAPGNEAEADGNG